MACTISALSTQYTQYTCALGRNERHLHVLVLSGHICCRCRRQIRNILVFAVKSRTLSSVLHIEEATVNLKEAALHNQNRKKKHVNSFKNEYTHPEKCMNL